MKKLVLAVAALGLISLTSCKKNYTCTCTANGTSQATDLGKQKKKDAQDACDTQNAAYALFGGSCTL